MDGAERWGSIWGKLVRRGWVGLRLVEGEKTRITIDHKNQRGGLCGPHGAREGVVLNHPTIWDA